MITIKLSAQNLKTFIAALAPVAIECRLHLEPGGIRVATVDTSNVAMVMAHLDNTQPQGIFLKYDLPKSIAIGVDLTAMGKALDLLKPDELQKSIATITLSGDAPKFMELRMSKYNCRFELPEEYSLRADVKPHDGVFCQTAKAVIDGETLRDGIEAAAKMATKIDIGMAALEDAPSMFFMESCEDGKHQIRTMAGEPPTHLSELTAWKGGNERSRFTTDYLLEMVREDGPLATAPLVEVHLRTGWPLRLEFDIPGGHVTYALAPRIERD